MFGHKQQISCWHLSAGPHGVQAKITFLSTLSRYCLNSLKLFSNALPEQATSAPDAPHGYLNLNLNLDLVVRLIRQRAAGINARGAAWVQGQDQRFRAVAKDGHSESH